MTETRKAALKEEIIAARGYWAPFHEELLQHASEFLEAYLAFQDGPARWGVLEPKLQELIYVAIDVSVNHMYPSGGRRHMELALKAGATPQEVLQVILVTTALAARHPLDVGLAILAEETLGEEHHEATCWQALPDDGKGCRSYEETARRAGPLSPRERELIALAVCAAPDCLFEAGIRRHMRAAIAAGATRAEIAAVLQLAAAISIHTCTIAVPALGQAVAAASGADVNQASHGDRW